MKIDLRHNLSKAEGIRRYVLGAALIGAVFASPAVPSWIALLACYPIFTAMTRWDPVDALLQNLMAMFGKPVPEVTFRRSATQ